MQTRVIVLLAALCVSAAATSAQAPQASTPGKQEAMVRRGDRMMGFSAEKTTHHFRLFADGGEITVTANDPQDAESCDAIRMHLSHIASMFSEGDFDAPMLIHDTTPPGVPTMKKLRGDISYRYEPVASGGRVRIQTRNVGALDAIHAFLLFQIIEHHTRDSGAIGSKPN